MSTSTADESSSVVDSAVPGIVVCTASSLCFHFGVIKRSSFLNRAEAFVKDPKDQDEVPSDDSGTTSNDVSSSNEADESRADDSLAESSKLAPTAVEDFGEPNSEVEAGNSESSDAQLEDTSNENGVDEDTDDEEDDLPEWEPLSPEIVEDEAIRGDFMLRWAVILLAFLLGCRHIADTVTLVRIRTGEHLASNGVLPPATDVFSYTAAERPWVNLGWLFDLLIAGVFGVGGATGLTLLTAMAASATCCFLHGITRDNLPTWWTSVCVGVALLMVNLQFTMLPQIITLLGVTWMLRGLHSWSQTGNQSTLWCLAGSLAVWSNLDPRAFIGWIVLLAYLIGMAIGQKSGRSSLHEDASLKGLAMATGAGFVALMVNPFGWHAVLSPIQLYGIEMPALARYVGRVQLPHELQLVPLFDPAVWNNLNLHTIAALTIAVVAAVTSVMNFSRLNIGLFATYIAVLGLSIACSHELGALALVSCVLASLNGQDWYRAHCRQEYTIETIEVLWSRAGRAITVLGFAAIAFLAISGRLMGPDGRRVGLGFSPLLAETIEAARDEVEQLPEGHIFTFRLDQADVLLWHGVPSFVDSRVGVFAGDDDILKTHNKARHALRRSAAKSASADPASGSAVKESDTWLGKRELWQVPFDEYQVKLVTPRMWGVSPDYNSYFDLLASPDWDLVSLGASTAFFSQAKQDPDEQLSNFNLGFFKKLAFEDCRVKPDIQTRVEWPRLVSSYQQFMSLPTPPVSRFSQRARHELVYLSAVANRSLPLERGDALGLAILALRDAAAGISEEADNAQIFSIQADVHRILQGLESNLMAEYQLSNPTQQRYFQRLYAMRQALIMEPENLQLIFSLAQLYQSAGRTDLTLEMVERALAVIRKLADSELSDQILQFARQLNQMKQQIAPQVETTNERIKGAMQQENVDRAQMAAALNQAGFAGLALQVLEEDRLAVAENQMAQLQLAFLLAETGRLEEASAMFANFEQMGNVASIPLAVVLQTCWLEMALGDYQSVARRCTERIQQLKSASTQAMLATVPFAMPSPQFLGESNIWPATQTIISSGTMMETAGEISILQWTSAMANIEAGDCTAAAELLKALIQDFPESQFRPLVKVWLHAMTDEEIPDTPPELEPGIVFHDDSDLVPRLEPKNSSSDSDPTVNPPNGDGSPAGTEAKSSAAEGS
jgi:tetratricopeptide (TPR) repeat protein